jgi:hypothetical protein
MPRITFNGTAEIPNSRMPQKVTSNPARMTSIGKFRKLAAFTLTNTAIIENNKNPKSLNNKPLRGYWGKAIFLPESEIKIISSVAKPVMSRINVDQIELNCTVIIKIQIKIIPILINTSLGLLTERNDKQQMKIMRRGTTLIQLVMRIFYR